MAGELWTQLEVEIVAREYFKVLRAELNGQSLSKADAIRKAAAALPTPRSTHTVDDRMRRISEELWKHGLPYVQGWRPSTLANQSSNTRNQAALIWSAIEPQAAAYRPGADDTGPPSIDEADDAPTGQAYLSDTERRLAIEEYAQTMLMQHFERLGWDVEDTHLNAPYDAIARKGSQIQYLEAKGTMSEGDSVLVTSGEVDWARDHPDQCVMGIVSGIRFGAAGAIEQGSGSLRLLDWAPDRGTLTPKQFSWAPGS